MSLDEVREFDLFDVLWLGESFDGLPLTTVLRTVEPTTHLENDVEVGGVNEVTFIYGDCDASAGGCALPLQVQIWPACVRSQSSYEIEPGVPHPYEALTVRGAPAGIYDEGDGGGRLEVYTGEVTVVIFGESVDQVVRAANVLVDVTGRGRVVDTLAPPVAGALNGTLRCTEGIVG